MFIMKSQKTVSVGRVVLFVPKRGDIEFSDANSMVIPAIVTKVWSELTYKESEVNLRIFPDNPHTTWRTFVPYDENKTPGTWHWPEIK